MRLNVNGYAWMTGKKQLPCNQTICYWFVELEKRGNITKTQFFRCQWNFSGTPCSPKHLQSSCRGTLSHAFSRPINTVQFLLYTGVSPSPASLPRLTSCPSARHETELLFSYASLLPQLIILSQIFMLV